MDDLISRQDAIDAVNEALNNSATLSVDGSVAYYEKEYDGLWKARYIIESLPSAQPEIIRCKDCKHYDGRPCGIVGWWNSPDDFCSKGERREDERNTTDSTGN